MGNPAALPGWQQEFDIFGSVLHPSVGIEKDVHVLVDVAVDGLLVPSKSPVVIRSLTVAAL